MKVERVYLAGKISKNCWRHEIVSDLRSALGRWDEGVALTDWPILEKAIFGKHHYVGPYFLSDDHGCGHGKNTHGIGTDNKPCIGFAWEQDGRIKRLAERRKIVQKKCFQSIGVCSLFFAWVDGLDAFGTLTELGYAKAMGKKIVVATPDTKKINDLWFALTAGSVVNAATPKEALRLVLHGRTN